MPNATFEFFETIAEELTSEGSRVITRADLQLNSEQAPVLDALKDELGVATTEEAIQRAVQILTEHFRDKGAIMPFAYDRVTGRFTAADRPFLLFVKQMRSIRSIGTRSRDFEIGVLQRLALRVTGSVHRIGHPRDVRKRKDAFNEYLRTLGFQRAVLLGKEKDGGFDILWLLPLGTIPHRPVVSVQCKNGEFDMAQADLSVGPGHRSLSQHGRLDAGVHVPCVLFNDYLYPELLTPKPLNFVPLGLSDLSAMSQSISSVAI